MGPIDADALMEECYEELEDDSLWHDEDTSKDYADGHDEGKRIMMAIIDQAPTIKTKQIKYYDEDENVWKTGSVIVE